MLAYYWLSIALVVAPILFVLFQELRWSKKGRGLPPGPRRLPIIGNIHLLSKNPHRDFFHLSQKHGPIMSMRFGSVPVVIVSSPDAAEKFLKTHDLSFASRPVSQAPWLLGFGERNFSFSPHGPYWRNMRKLCTTELLSSQRISSFESMRREEVGLLVSSIQESGSYRIPVDLSATVLSTVSRMGCRLVLGKNYMEEYVECRKLKDHVQELTKLAAVPDLADYFPFVRAFDLQGIERGMKPILKAFNDFFDKVIDDHVQSQQKERSGDFVDTLMAFLSSGQTEFEFDRRHVKCMLMDMFIPSMDTSATSIDWALAELMRHPLVRKKLQEEIQEKVGMDRMVEELDLEGLEYLDAVVKETLRLHPVAPLLLPHEALEDCVIDGYHIKQKSLVLINFWAIGHDPNVWPEPNSFIPERFLGSKTDLRGRDFQLIPFGSGRRMCPGMHLGLTVLRLVLAQLTHCFDWELPNNQLPSDMDMTESFGLVTSRTQHLSAVPTYRLRTSI